ncbi:MAG: hypothetical protein QOK16_3678 [Solirubrobacteraceae bacterium]|nr:hypothetical protein [Solirubrobacteraceae bacterium]
MAELVRHLEAHGCVDRVPDRRTVERSSCRRTTAGDVFAIVREFIEETEQRLTDILGAQRMSRLRDDLQVVRQTAQRRTRPRGPAQTWYTLSTANNMVESSDVYWRASALGSESGAAANSALHRPFAQPL